jgi:hypothetical protein
MMGMLTIHKHAPQPARKGCCNGDYRAIVLCPAHLIKKWQDELEATIPGVKRAFEKQFFWLSAHTQVVRDACR